MNFDIVNEEGGGLLDCGGPLSDSELKRSEPASSFSLRGLPIGIWGAQHHSTESTPIHSCMMPPSACLIDKVLFATMPAS